MTVNKYFKVLFILNVFKQSQRNAFGKYTGISTVINDLVATQWIEFQYQNVFEVQIIHLFYYRITMWMMKMYKILDL